MKLLPEERIKESRERKGFTQADMAKRLAISLRQYQKYERGLFPKFKKETVRKIEEILRIQVYDDIYEQTVPRESNQDRPEVRWQDYAKVATAPFQTDLKDEIISLLRRENERLQNQLDASLNELDQRTKVIAGVQSAMMEILMALAEDRKVVYNKTVGILKKHGLEGSFL